MNYKKSFFFFVVVPVFCSSPHRISVVVVLLLLFMLSSVAVDYLLTRISNDRPPHPTHPPEKREGPVYCLDTDTPHAQTKNAPDERSHRGPTFPCTANSGGMDCRMMCHTTHHRIAVLSFRGTVPNRWIHTKRLATWG